MNRRQLHSFVLLGLAGLAPRLAAAANASFPDLTWEQLVPPGWDPAKAFEGRDLGMLQDGDPKAMELMQQLRKVWDEAPVNNALDGQRARLPGYIVPLEESGGALREFLLVPYFGACIHTPPPPANQIVHIVADPPVKGFRSMDAVWVQGTLKTQRGESLMGTSGYRMQASGVQRYDAQKR